MAYDRLAFKGITMNTSTVLLVSRNSLSRASLARLFVGSAFEMIAEIEDVGDIGSELSSSAELGDDVDEAIETAERQVPVSSDIPDIVLVECTGAGENVQDTLKRLRRIFPATPAVVLSNDASMASVVACFAAGARGNLTKNISRSALLTSMQLAVLGEMVFPTALADLYVAGPYRRLRRRRPSSGRTEVLSDREIDIVQCLLRGEPNKLIANRFDLMEATIKVHIKNVFRKIKVTNRTQAAIWAYKNGFLPFLGNDSDGYSATLSTRGFSA